MELAKLHIIIVAENTPRSTYFRGLLEEEFGLKIHIDVEPYDRAISSLKGSENSLFIVDLMDFERSANQAVRELKEKHKQSKIIALHIYQSAELIKPLLKNGADGYLSSDPTRSEFLSAIKTVMRGDAYTSVRP